MKKIIQKIIYKDTKEFGYRCAAQYISEKNYLLDLVMETFNDLHSDFITIEIYNDIVYIWNDFHEKHYASRDEVPKFTITKENYNQVVEQWNLNIIEPAPYLVLTKDEDGFVNLKPKRTLSQDDLDCIASEKLLAEKYGFAKDFLKMIEDIKKKD
ncbi:hypothetical protein HYV11_02695 [Candidatus Dependentiae bacterium]|nr:hypothetical protein [Candidatus Dependentiae bacterium]